MWSGETCIVAAAFQEGRPARRRRRAVDRHVGPPVVRWCGTIVDLRLPGQPLVYVNPAFEPRLAEIGTRPALVPAGWVRQTETDSPGARRA